MPNDATAVAAAANTAVADADAVTDGVAADTDAVADAGVAADAAVATAAVADAPADDAADGVADTAVMAEMEPDLVQARRTAVMAHSVVIRLRQLGLPDDMDPQLARLSTDLGDLWGAQKEFTDLLNDMLKNARDWDAMGDALTDLRASIEHIAWHIDSVREPIERIAERAYAEAQGQTAAELALGRAQVLDDCCSVELSAELRDGRE